jgi:outer membrane lipoprotein-sorting protein
MTRRSLAVLVAAFGVLVAALPARAQSVDEIIAKNVQAKGGLEKLRAVQSLKQTAHLTLQGMEATLTIYGKRPNLSRQEMNLAGQAMVMGFDGETAWQMTPMMGSAGMAVTGPQADAIKEQADFDGPLVDYKAKGYTIELVGTESVGGKPAYHLKLTGKDQRVSHCYLDVVTGLEAKIVTDGRDGPVEQELSDYRDVEGLKVPFAVRTLSGGQVLAQIIVDKVELNVKFDDAIFKMPRGQ